jgi:hypothetical protein
MLMTRYNTLILSPTLFLAFLALPSPAWQWTETASDRDNTEDETTSGLDHTVYRTLSVLALEVKENIILKWTNM